MGNKHSKDGEVPKPAKKKSKKSKKGKKGDKSSSDSEDNGALTAVTATPAVTEAKAEAKAPVGPPEYYVRIARLFRVRLGDVAREEEDEDERAVLDLLQNPSDKRIDWVDTEKESMTSLHWAAYYGSHHVTKRLIELKADVNLQNSLGFTPLLFAARSGRELCGAILIEGGANIDIKDANGNGVGQWGNMRFFDALLMARFRQILDDLEAHVPGEKHSHLRDIILDYIGSQEFEIDTSPPKGYGYELQQYEDE